MQQQNNSKQELLHFIRRSMRQGDVDAVYYALSQSSLPDAEKFSIRYKIELEQFQNGDIDAEIWCLKQIQIFDEILNWPDFQQKEVASTVDLDKKLLLRFVSSQELDNAFTLCESIGDSSILMQARYMLFKKMFDQGLIEIATWELIRHSTLYQLWELGQPNEFSKNFYLKYLKGIKKWLRHLTVFLIIELFDLSGRLLFNN